MERAFLFTGCRWSGGESGDVMRALRIDGGLGYGFGRVAALNLVAMTAWMRGSWTGDRLALFDLWPRDGFVFRGWIQGRGGEHPLFWY